MRVLQSNPAFDMEEYIAIKDCFDSNWFSEGNKTKQFEDKIKEMIEVKYGICCPNGTLALYLALKSLDIDVGDEVIVPNHTFFASASSVVMAGGVPVFVDVDKDNFQIDIEKCQKVLTQKTKFIMPVNLYGYSCDMEKVMEFAKNNGLSVVEDSCQALNVGWNGKKCGSFGNANAFSFFSDKSLSTVEGGFVATNDKNVYNKLIYMKNQGRLNRGSFQHAEMGWNFRLNDIQAAMGLVQIKKFEKMINRRLEIYSLYNDLLDGIKQIKIIKPPIGSSHIPFRTIILCENGSQDLMNFMLLNEIEPRTLFFPLHLQPAFHNLRKQYGYKDDDFPNSVYAFKHGICLPCWPQMTDEQVLYVAKIIKEYYNQI